MWFSVVLIILAYLVGSVASAIVVCRLMGYGDPRAVGSGNPGATNVLRAFGKKAAALTLAGDLLKGLLPVLIGKLLRVNELTLAGIASAAFLGHLFPVFFGFRGGKGVATYIGVLFGLSWPLGVFFALTWVFIAAMFRISSLAALTASAVSPFAAWWLTRSGIIALALVGLVCLIFYRHAANIRKLLDGTESKIGIKS
jgi:glycerol-3-phosphate acyltransferase PlsY